MACFPSREHKLFAQEFGRFVQKELAPQVDRWERDGETPRSVWRACGAQGFLCPTVAPEYGGAGADFGYSYVINHELARAGVPLMLGLHSDIVVPYIEAYGSIEQKQRWLPGCVSGEIVAAIAMTEPDTGSDLQAIRTTAVRDGDHYVINGSKIFISYGMSCDLVIVVCKTAQGAAGRNGLSLIVVENGTPGFVKAHKLQKMGLHSQDTAELVFEDCRVPVGNLLGQENAGFQYLMNKLQTERLVMAIIAVGWSDRVLSLTLDYVKNRQAFGKPIGSFQNTQFKLAEMATEVAMGRVFVERLTEKYMAGEEIVSEVSMAKWWTTEMVNRLAYQGVQLHGGYGFMEEYEIARIYRDVRMQTIAAGTTEIMKQTIAKRLGL